MTDPGNALTQWAVGLVLGVLGGSGGTLVALRTKLAMMQRDIGDERDARKKLEVHLDERIDRLDKRQLAMLRLTADIARKVGVDGRQFDDALVRMLTDEPT